MLHRPPGQPFLPLSNSFQARRLGQRGRRMAATLPPNMQNTHALIFGACFLRVSAGGYPLGWLLRGTKGKPPMFLVLLGGTHRAAWTRRFAGLRIRTWRCFAWRCGSSGTKPPGDPESKGGRRKAAEARLGGLFAWLVVCFYRPGEGEGGLQAGGGGRPSFVGLFFQLKPRSRSNIWSAWPSVAPRVGPRAPRAPRGRSLEQSGLLGGCNSCGFCGPVFSSSSSERQCEMWLASATFMLRLRPWWWPCGSRVRSDKNVLFSVSAIF